jgi:hypothetical protein
MNTIIPTTVVDDFFEDPDSIRAFGLRQQYQRDQEGRWPGSRAMDLNQLNSQLFTHVASRLLSVFWDITATPVHWRAHGTFQRVTNNYAAGWIHQDADSLLTAIVYLTPNAPLTSGTSIYRRKDITVPIPEAWDQAKRQGYLTGQMDTAEYLHARDATNRCYEETLQVNNVYNRLLIFDSRLYHGVRAFDTGEEDRLTLTMFFTTIGTPVLSPIQRMNRTIE